jgi:hypothetical protein
MQYIGRGALKIGSRFVTYGNEFDPKDVDVKTMESLKKAGMVGVLPEPYDPNKHHKARVAELEAEVAELRSKLKAATKKEKTK